MDELDRFVVDYILDRGWLGGVELSRLGRVSKVFADQYTEDGLSLSRVEHAARRRLGDWLGVESLEAEESWVALLILVDRRAWLPQGLACPLDCPLSVVAVRAGAQNSADAVANAAAA